MITRFIQVLLRHCLLLAGLSIANYALADFAERKLEHIDYPDWFASDAFLDLEELLQTSREQDKLGAMLLFTTEGCSYCEVFKRDIREPAVAERLQNSFVSLGLEIFDDAELITPEGDSLPVKQFALDEGVEFAPTLLFLAPGGERMGRYTGYQTPERFEQILDYLDDGAWRYRSLGQFLAARTGPLSSGADEELIQDPLFEQAPYALDRSRFAAARPLLVLFMRAGCEACEDFHRQVLAAPEVRSTLAQFDIVQLDAGDTRTPVLTPDGSKLTPADWYAQSGLDQVPALVFFSETGEEVLQTDALVQKGRMLNSLNFTLEKAYEKGWTYQRFARTKSIERAQAEAAGDQQGADDQQGTEDQQGTGDQQKL